MRPDGDSGGTSVPVAISAKELARVAGPLFTMLQRSGVALVVTNPRLPDNPIVFVNHAFSTLTGYRAEEALGRNCRFLQGPATDPATVAELRAAVQDGREIGAEIRNFRKDGTPFWNRLSIVPIPHEASPPDFFLATQVDCSERHAPERTEGLLRESALRLRAGPEPLDSPLSGSGVAAWDWHIDHGRIEGDSRFAALYGLTPAEAAAGVSPATFFSIIHQQDRPRIRLAIGAVLRGAEVFAKEYRILVQGAVRWVRARGRAHADSQNGPVRFSGVLIDITEQKIVEEQLRIAQTAGGIGTFTYVDGFATAQVSAQFCKLLGLQTSSTLPVRTINAVVASECPPIVAMAPEARPGTSRQAEFRIRRPADGQERWIACRGEFALDSESVALRFTGVIYDVTEAKRTERALRELNETLESQIEERTRERDHIWQASSDLLCVANRHGFLLSLNPAWTGLLGWSEDELKATPLLDFVHPDDRNRTATAAMAALLEGKPQLGFENRFRNKDGGYRWFSWNAVPRSGQIYAVIRDVTEVKEQAERARHLEEQLRQSQKMEAVGQLTGGLAHDFNNLLTGITGSLELLQTRVTQGRLKDVDRYVSAAQGAARRAAALTHRLLAFSRRQTLAPKPTDVNRLVAGMIELIERTVGPEIDVEMVAAPGLWNTLVDPSQLENALLNLCINARDAMPDGGKLIIETANRRLDGRAGDDRELPAGPYVSLCVSDNGTGMTPEVIARAFDPFFTTKPLGVGTGLGLSMIYGFARQSGGQVRIYSEVGQGTTISIYLPRSADEAEGAETAAPITEIPRAERGECVLVVDDEPTVRMLVTETLEGLGYRAIEAADGPAGLNALRAEGQIDLLVTDVGLSGGMNGRQFAHAARELRPDLKVLFITGYAENAVLNHGHLDPDMNVLTKPFGLEELASRIRDLIGNG